MNDTREYFVLYYEYGFEEDFMHPYPYRRDHTLYSEDFVAEPLTNSKQFFNRFLCISLMHCIGDLFTPYTFKLIRHIVF